MENEKNALNDISKAELKARGVSSLATRPNAPSRYGEGGLTAEQLKERFDALSGILAERINKIHAYLKASDLDENISITIGGVPKTLAQFAEDLESGEAANYLNVYNADAKKSLQTVITSILQKISEHVEENEEDFRSTSARIDGAVTTINIEPVVDRETIRIELTALNDKGTVLFSDSVSIANADYLIASHNESTDAHQDIRELIQSNGMQIASLSEDVAEVRAVAEGRVRARAYRTWNDALLAISSFGTLEEARKEFAIGDQIYIRTPKSTDAWVSGFETRHEPYPGGLGDDLDPFDKWESTEIHVGYLIISPLEAPDIDLTGYVTTDDFDEYGEKVDNDIANAKAHSVAEAKAYTAEEVAGVSDRVDILDKKVENLRAALSPEYFTTDSSVEYTKQVPATALPFAEVQEVGGMSYAVDGVLKNAAVTALETIGTNLLDLTPALNECLRDNGDGTYTLTRVSTSGNGRFSGNTPFVVNKGQVMFCQCEIVDTNIEGRNKIALQSIADDGKTAVSGISFGLVDGGEYYTAQADGTRYVRLYIPADQPVGAYITFRNPMIQFVDYYKAPVKPYAPYVKRTYPIPAEVQALEGWGLGVNETYHNRLDWAKKQYRQEVRRIVFDGTENWHKPDAAQGNYVYYQVKLPEKPMSDRIGLMNGYDFVHVGDLSGGLGWMMLVSGWVRVRPDITAYATLDAWKTHLAELYSAGTPLAFVYALASPTATDLPNLTDDNFIEVEGGGIVTAVNEGKLAAPTKIEYQLKEVTA